MKRVLGRTQHLEPSLQAYTITLLPALEAFMDSYDRLRTMTTTRGQELREGKVFVDILSAKMGSWVSQVSAARVLQNFTRSDFGRNPAVPDDVISDAESLASIVAAHEELEPGTLVFAQELLDDMLPAIEVAKKEWAEADGLKSAHQNLVLANRRNAEEFSNYLVAFRRSLAREIGRNHPDYQTLRSTKIDREVYEDGEEADLPPEMVGSAAAAGGVVEVDAGDEGEGDRGDENMDMAEAG